MKLLIHILIAAVQVIFLPGSINDNGSSVRIGRE